MFPAEYGGLAGGSRELTAVMEALGAGFVVEPMLEEIIMAGGMLAQAGSAAQKHKWLPAIMCDTVHTTLAHFEHTLGFNLSDVRVRAEPRSEGKAMVTLAICGFRAEDCEGGTACFVRKSRFHRHRLPMCLLG
jgi:alkylation response protein AidB-like acyl-CoA dehydrogenase